MRGHQWWHVDLGAPKQVHTVVIANRQDCCKSRLVGARVCVGTKAGAERKSNDETGLTCKKIPEGSSGPEIKVTFGTPVEGQYVAVKGKDQWITLCEVEVFGPK